MDLTSAHGIFLEKENGEFLTTCKILMDSDDIKT